MLEVLQNRGRVKATADMTISVPLCLFWFWSGGKFEMNCRKEVGKGILSAQKENMVFQSSSITEGNILKCGLVSGLTQIVMHKDGKQN